MRPRTTFLLLLLALLLVGAAVFLERGKGFGRADPASAGGTLPALSLGEIDGVDIVSPRGPVRLVRRDGVWKLVQPVEDRPDREKLESVFLALAELASRRFVSPAEMRESGAGRQAYGLDPATRISLRLSSGERAAAEYWIGKAAPFEKSAYLQLAGEANGVHIANVDLRALLDVPAAAFRDQKVLRIDPERLVRMDWEQGGALVEVARAEPGAQWRLTKPLQTRVDVEQLEELQARLAQLPVAEFVETGAIAGADTLQSAAAVRLWHEGDTDPLILRVLQPPAALAGDGLILRGSDRNTLLRVEADDFPVLETDSGALRDRRLARFGLASISGFTLRYRDQDPIVLERRGTEWVLLAPELVANSRANAALVERLFEGLGKEEIVRFASDSAADLPRLGLDPPELEIAFQGQDLAAYGAPEDDTSAVLLISGEYLAGDGAPSSAAGGAEQAPAGEPEIPGPAGEAAPAEPAGPGQVEEASAEPAPEQLPEPAPAPGEAPDTAPASEPPGDPPPAGIPPPPPPGGTEARPAPEGADPKDLRALANVHYGGEPFVFAVEAGFQSLAPAQPVKWRDLAVLDFSLTTLRSLELVSRGGTVRAEYNPSADQWTAADGQGNALTDKLDLQRTQIFGALLGTLNAHSWMDDRSDALRLLAEPELEIRFELELPGAQPGETQRESHVLTLAPTTRATPNPRFYYGRLDQSPDVFLLLNDIYGFFADGLLRREAE